MSAPLPEALRARFQTLIEEGLSGRGSVAPEAFTSHRSALGSFDPTNRTCKGRAARSPSWQGQAGGL